jgi:hypothetical protein
VQTVLDAVDSLRCAWNERTLSVFDAYLRLDLQPATGGASRVEIYLYDDGDIGIGAGDGVFFTFSENWPQAYPQDPTTRLRAVLSAISAGTLQETIYRRGPTAYRWRFRLALDEYEVQLDRADLGRLLKCFWRRHSRTTVRYRPWETERR